MDELAVMVDFACKVGIVLARGLEDHLVKLSKSWEINDRVWVWIDAHLCAICQIVPGKIDFAK